MQVELNLQDLMLIVLFDGMLLMCAVESGTVFNEGGTVFTVLLMCSVWVCVYVDECNFDQV